MRLNGVTIAPPHGEKKAFRQRAAKSVSVFRIQIWTAALLPISSKADGSSAAAASMRCRIAQQAWSPCWMVASSPGERLVLTWNQQRVEFVHDGSGQMMMRVGEGETAGGATLLDADHSPAGVPFVPRETFRWSETGVIDLN